MSTTTEPAEVFATTFCRGAEVPAFAAMARQISVPPQLDRLPLGRFRPRDEIRLFTNVLRAARREQMLLLFSSRGRLKPELLATILIGFWPRRWRPAIVLYGEMFQPNTGLRHRIERLIMRLADRAIERYVVYSRAECEFFPRAWNLSPDKIRYCYQLREGEFDTLPSVPQQSHVFAGGDSFRDYETVLAAARQLPEVRFVLCTTRLAGRDDLPANVEAGPVPFTRFVELMLSAAVVLVPLQQGLHRITGTMTYLESMWLKKLTIVPDALAVREYVEDGVTGCVVDGSTEDYMHAIRWAMTPENASQVARICEQAHETVSQRFTLERHAKGLLDIMAEITGEDKASSYPKIV